MVMKIDSTLRVAPGSGVVETTTVRAVILKQIAVLQKIEASLSQDLAKLGTDTASIEQRIALQQQIRGIEDQIKSLQIALLQPDADRTVQVLQPAEEEITQTIASTAEQKDNSNATVGSVIDTVA
jgi:TolA-binding protein